jgi:putative transposase
VLEVYVTKTRDRRAAPAFLKRALKRFGSPRTIVTDRLRSYRAALSDLGVGDRQDTSRWLNNRAENSHQPFRRRERSMQRIRSDATLQKFISVHAAIHNHFNLDRHLTRRTDFRQRRDAALAEWRQLAI